jgi:hypothetical protein
MSDAGHSIQFLLHWLGLISDFWLMLNLHRLPIKLKLLTGAYILQSNRIKMHKNELNALCLLCEKDGETIEHFILDCEQLKEVREPIII